MEGFGAILQSIAATGLRNQVRREGDYIDNEGLLVCGKCGKRRQAYDMIMSDTNENERVKTKIVDLCDCDKEEKRKEEETQQRKKDLERIAELRQLSLMDNRFQRADFSRFSVDSTNEETYKLCRRYATAFSEMLKKNQGLLMWGGVGTGKTFAAACIANYLLNQKIPVVMTSFVRILSILQERGNFGELSTRLNRAKLVIFDDLGA